MTWRSITRTKENIFIFFFKITVWAYQISWCETHTSILSCIKSIKQFLDVIMHCSISTNTLLLRRNIKQYNCQYLMTHTLTYRQEMIKLLIIWFNLSDSNIILALSIQLSKSASLRGGGGLVTPESRVNVVGMNCNTSRAVMNIYSSGSGAICIQCTQNPLIVSNI